jgi:hypothetical protein
MVIYHTTDTLPVFQFSLSQDLIDQAFYGAIELRTNGDSFDKQETNLMVANKNVYGEKVITKVKFVSNTTAHKNNNIKALSLEVEKLCKEVSNDFYDVDFDFKVVNSTVLMYDVEDKISRHIHFPYTFVAATYLHVNEKSSPITIGAELVIQPSNGMCLIFPGHLSHEVKETSEDRIMITMDVSAVIQGLAE